MVYLKAVGTPGVVFAFLALTPLTALSDTPNPGLSMVPNVLLTPSSTCIYCAVYSGYEVVVRGTDGPIEGATVTLVFSTYADTLLAWCAGQSHSISATTDINGIASFTIHGGGCIDPAEAPVNPVVSVSADGVLLAEVGVVSPDVVDLTGRKATEGWNPAGLSECSTADGVYITGPILNASYDFCTDINSDGVIGIADAVGFTPFIQSGAFCQTD